MCCRVYLAVATNADNRGLMVQQGCVKVQFSDFLLISSYGLMFVTKVYAPDYKLYKNSA